MSILPKVYTFIWNYFRGWLPLNPINNTKRLANSSSRFSASSTTLFSIWVYRADKCLFDMNLHQGG